MRRALSSHESTIKLILAFVLSFLCLPGLHTLRAEGSMEVGSNQGLTAETVLHVDIQDPDKETFVWTGQGNVTVLPRTGSMLVFLGQEQ